MPHSVWFAGSKEKLRHKTLTRGKLPGSRFDSLCFRPHNIAMETLGPIIVPTTPLTPAFTPTPDELRKICEAQDKAREELRKKLGTVNVAVNLVRAGRDE